MFYKCKYDELKHSHTNVTSVIKDKNGNVYEPLYKVSYHIACYGQVHMTAENLIIPYVENIVSCVLGDNHLKVVIKVSLSNSMF
jgi:hypothetical protein